MIVLLYSLYEVIFLSESGLKLLLIILHTQIYVQVDAVISQPISVICITDFVLDTII